MISKLILKYDHFNENTFTNFGDLRESKDFADVTLACEDGQQVEGHKVILAEQVLITKLSHSQHHINNINIMIKINSVE